MSHFKVEEEERSTKDSAREDDTESVSSAESVRTMVPAEPTTPKESPKKKLPMSTLAPAGQDINLQEMVQ